MGIKDHSAETIRMKERQKALRRYLEGGSTCPPLIYCLIPEGRLRPLIESMRHEYRGKLDPRGRDEYGKEKQ